jgi:SOS-response transcriptional repressor LexA
MSIPIVENDSLNPLPWDEAEGLDNMTPGYRLKWLREKRGYKTATAAADAIGVKPVTYIAHEANRGTEPSLPRYAKFYRVPVDFFYAKAQTLELGTEAQNQPVVEPSGEGLMVRGFVHASVWQDQYRLEDNEPERLSVAYIAGHPRERQYALRVTGESMNRKVKPGGYAVCLEWHGPVKNDDVVIVERRKPDGTFQATIKKVRRRNGEVELWPDSDHPNHQEPIIVKEKDLAEGEEIAVVAKVLSYVINP